MRPASKLLGLLVSVSVAGCVTPRATVTPEAAPAPLPPVAAPHLPSVRPLAPEPPGVKTLARVTLGGVGDVLYHDAVKRTAAEHAKETDDAGYSWLYAGLKDELSAPDVMFANLETPVAPDAGKGTREFVFNAGLEAVRALKASGIDLVSVANNHAFDQGRKGFLETLKRLDEVGMPFVGGGPVPNEAGPRMLNINGVTVAWLGFASFFNQTGNDCDPKESPCVRAGLANEPEKAEAAVREAAAKADAVVVSIHWGKEYTAQPIPEQVELAHRLAEAGALVIFGHHPHVLEPLELYRRADGQVTAIAYSLGNFISNQSRNYVFGVSPDKVGDTRDAALVRVQLAKRDYGRGVTRTELAGLDFLPLWTENDTSELDLKKNPQAKPTIRVVAIDRALAEVRAEIATLPDPIPKANRALEARFVKLRKREDLLARRKQIITNLLGEDFLRELPPPAPKAATASK